RLLGVQGIGPGDVVKRVDVAATAMHFGATVDQLAEVDLAYAPPFNTPIDPLHHTANAWRNKLQELVPTVSAAQVKEKLDRGDDFVLLDVRTPQQYAAKHIEDDRVLLVTLGDMRQRLADIPRDKEIVTLCAMGSRAYEALRILKGAGFENVKLMEGGLQAWPYEID
ncbi:MAG: rhodanese-like domain-containing protein, partial [Bacillota bacterium]